MLFIGMWANLLDREVIFQLKQYSRWFEKIFFFNLQP